MGLRSYSAWGWVSDWTWHLHTLCVKVEVVTHCDNVCVFFTWLREAEEFVTRGRDRIGSRYKKVRYVEYTDDTFMEKMLRSPAEQHLGILGKTKNGGIVYVKTTVINIKKVFF